MKKIIAHYVAKGGQHMVVCEDGSILGIFFVNRGFQSQIDALDEVDKQCDKSVRIKIKGIITDAFHAIEQFS